VRPCIAVAVDATRGAKAVGRALRAAGAMGNVSTPFALKAAGIAVAMFASELAEAWLAVLTLSAAGTVVVSSALFAAGTVVASQAAEATVEVLTSRRNEALHGCGRRGCGTVRPCISVAVDATRGAKAVGGALRAAGEMGNASALFALKVAGVAVTMFASELAEAWLAVSKLSAVGGVVAS
jgi:hypothetical protein